MASNYENGQYVFARNFGGRWFIIGTPINGSNIHKAYARDNAANQSFIWCYLDADGEGDAVRVDCSIVGGSDLDEAIPRLEDGDMIPVWKIDDHWWCTSVFQTSEDCT